MKEIFVVIGKLPRHHFSKTRLAADLGEELAEEFYHAFINDFFRNYSETVNSIPLFFFGTPQEDETEKYFGEIFKKYGIDFHFGFQKDLPFFERIESIFSEIQKEHGEVFIHLTGTDIPDFPFQFLQRDFTPSIGPDDDGGYYYLGCPSKFGSSFKIEGAKVFDETLKSFEKSGVTLKSLPHWSDIDNKEDLLKLKHRDSSSPAVRKLLQGHPDLF
jgi:glycosyltransferase A (GT-A) superfamily protein (DUF2064 family)